MAALVQMMGEIETVRTACFQTDAFLVWGSLPCPPAQYMHTVHVRYRKAVHLGNARFPAHMTEVYINSNPEGSGTQWVYSTCMGWGALGQQRI